MLVPAMTFAWWLVSMSAPSHHPHHRGVAPSESSPVAESGEATAEHETVEATAAVPTDLQPRPAEYTGSAETEQSVTADDAEDTSGERVTLKVVTPAIVRAARTYLDLPMGAERAETIEGQRYVFVLERHYHPPGFVGGPHGWHKGVTVYALH